MMDLVLTLMHCSPVHNGKRCSSRVSPADVVLSLRPADWAAQQSKDTARKTGRTVPVLTPRQLSPDQKAKRIRRCRRRRPVSIFAEQPAALSNIRTHGTGRDTPGDVPGDQRTAHLTGKSRKDQQPAISPNPNALYAPAQRTIPKPSNRP